MNSRILVVDDEPMNIKMVEVILKDTPMYQIVGATSGMEALKMLDAHEIDVILLDVKMPEMDGFATMESIRQKYNMPIVLMTGDRKMTITDSISRWAEESGLEAKVIEGSILFPVENGDVSWIARVTALEEDAMIYIVTAYPFDISEEKRVDVMKEINKINVQLKMGTFYIENEDGQVNFRLGQWVTDGENRDKWVNELIFIAMNVTGSYYKMFMDILRRIYINFLFQHLHI